MTKTIALRDITDDYYTDTPLAGEVRDSGDSSAGKLFQFAVRTEVPVYNFWGWRMNDGVY